MYNSAVQSELHHGYLLVSFVHLAVKWLRDNIMFKNIMIYYYDVFGKTDLLLPLY